MESKDVFISYKAEDYEKALWVKTELEKQKISCWMAPESIPGGSNYAVEIPRAIRGCTAFVIVMTNHTQDSIWVPKELDQAINAGKMILPYLWENVALRDDFSFYLSNVQRYPAYENKEREMKRLVTRIQAALDARGQETTEEAVVENTGKSVHYVAPEENKAPAKKTWLLIAGGILGLALIFVIIGVILSHRGKNEPEQTTTSLENQTVETETEMTTEEVVSHSAEATKVKIVAPSGINVRTFNKNIKTIKERLEILAEGEELDFSLDEEEATVYFTEAMCHEQEISYLLRAYITRAMNLYLFDKSDVSSAVPLTREEIASVKRLHGKAEEPQDAKIREVLEITDAQSDYDYILVTLNEEGVRTHEDHLANVGDSWRFGQDVVGNNPYVYMHAFAGPDGKSIYVVNGDGADVFLDLMVYNWTHEPLADSFSFVIDMNKLTTWDDVSSCRYPGENQVNLDQITEKSVTFSYRESYAGAMTAGEMIDTELELKRRLDLFGCPYAFGQQMDGNARNCFVVCLPVSQMAMPFLELLSARYYLQLRAEGYMCRYYIFDYADEGVVDETNADGTITLKLPIKYASDLENVQTMTNLLQANGKEDTYIYLYCGDYPLFAAPMEGFADEEKGSFTEICGVENGRIVHKPLTEEYRWLIDFFERFTKTSSSDLSTIYYASYQLNDSAAGEVADTADFGIPFDVGMADLENEILKIYPDATVTVSDVGLDVKLDMNVTESFATAAPEAAQRIYELVGFEESAFQTLRVVPIDENNAITERARILFAKMHTDVTLVSETTPQTDVYVYGIFVNGRMESYKEAVVEKINASPFYQALTVEDKTVWQTTLE